MARPKKTGLDYFPFDVDFFEDEKIVCIAGEFGLKGEITAVKLLCAVYRNGYFIEWSDMLKMKMLRSLPGISLELLEQIVARLVKWGFFDKALFDSVRVLTSKGIQRRFLNSTRKRLGMDEYPYWLIPAPETTHETFLPPETRVSAPETTHERVFLPPEIPQSKGKKIKKLPTDVGSKKSPPPSPPPTLEGEIAALKGDMCWLDQLQVLHGMDTATLEAKLDEFRLHCAADGKERHESLADAKQHFNNWLRITAGKQTGYGKENRGTFTSKQEANDYALRQYLADREALDKGVYGTAEEPF